MQQLTTHSDEPLAVLVRRVADDPAFEVVPLAAVDDVAGPGGPVPRARLPRPACPVAAELLRFSG